ncbi:hypothetical protein [Alloacidobacterium sp.]|uniref:hypothetical protein n=1 Tax=Alloacidobacterium sp. TaxID=2951999 RepID=UPI002D45444B|nr:hypothetical protein [Alloacidobacterium sp.]HYK36989.1 hypothetical protein [Alloacidobacterium sp.]
MWHQRCSWAKGLFLAILALAVSCKTSDDAKAVADQMTAAAKDLGDYYDALATLVDNHARLEHLQQATIGVPFDQQDMAQLQDVHAALEKRADAAHELANLAEAFTGLTGSTAPADVSNSAANLGMALSTVPQLPGAANASAILQNAGQILTKFAQERDERKMAKSMEPTMSALSQMFSQEKPAYDSIDRTYTELAQGIALDLLSKNQVDPGSLMDPALKPFGLAARTPSEQVPQGLADYAKEQIRTRGEADIAAHAKASDAMDSALKELSKRTHELATGGRMPERGFTVELTDVEAWVKLILSHM